MDGGKAGLRIAYSNQIICRYNIAKRKILPYSASATICYLYIA